jgi:hypothetical protein
MEDLIQRAAQDLERSYQNCGESEKNPKALLIVFGFS